MLIYNIILFEGIKNKSMAKINIFEWLYKHSPINFYSITNQGKTIIKSINGILLGYEYDRIFDTDELNSLKIVRNNYKRFSTFFILLAYFILIYFFMFPNFNLLNNLSFKILIIFLVILLPLIIMIIISKIFEYFLINKYGQFTKTKFPYDNFVENQSYKEFKLEILKIFSFLIVIIGIYICIGSPYKTSLNLINSGKYKDAIKITTIWSKIIPIDSHWYSLRGYARFYTGDYDNAIKDYDKAYELRNDEFKSMNFDNKIYIKYYNKDYQSALKDFDKAIESSTGGEKNSLLWDKAQFLFNIGRYKESLKIYNDLLVKSTEDRVYLMENRLYFERAQVYRELGESSFAESDIETAKNLDLDVEFQNSIPKPALLLEEI